MKNKLITLLILLISSGPLMAVTIVEGTWEREALGDKIYLYEIDMGELNEVASTLLDGNRNFTFALPDKAEQLYVIGSESRTKENRYVFYLKPNDHLQFKVDNKSYTLTGKKNSAENQELKQWHDKIYELEAMSVYKDGMTTTYVEFIPLLNTELNGLQNYKVTHKVSKRFAEVFEAYRSIHLPHMILHFFYSPRIAHPHKDERPEILSEITADRYTKNANLLNYYPWGQTFFNQVMMNDFILTKGTSSAPASIDMEMATIHDPLIKGERLLYHATRIKSHKALTEFKDKYNQYFVTPVQKEAIEKLLVERYLVEKDAAAFDFTYRDIDGKEVSLSDFRGKYVYIDIWATWCGPCKAESPHWSKLVGEYKDVKDIVFLGVSVDKEKDKAKWDAMIKSGEVSGGVQLFAGKDSEGINKAYEVRGIPRFILLDKEGKVKEIDAPRPSSDAIRPLLNSVTGKEATGQASETLREAFGFTYKDIAGKDVSLSDFKGKNVYIDVWATWCGPCMAQAPHWSKLVEEYKNREDIVFLGVSVDKSADKAKWAAAVGDGTVAGGVQLFTGDDSAGILKPYEITGIPRFILINKEGMILEYKAPRPSSDEIRPLLNSL